MIALPRSLSSTLLGGVHLLSSLAVLAIAARGLAELRLDQMNLIITNAIIFLIAGYTGIFVRSLGYNIAIIIAASPTILFAFVSYFYYDNILSNPQIKDGFMLVSLYGLIGTICTVVFMISRIWKYAVAKHEARSSKSGSINKAK